ncbi:MAG: hypothetical protein IPI65_00020 [Bacteroidetes bacterium]|nr:hypothetical protein [Bacteroidota bacterium]
MDLGLIQNAKDNVAADFPNKKVSILIELNKNEFIFSHNYGYFTNPTLKVLSVKSIKDSTVDEVEHEKQTIIIGNFGTGFLTTHLLSKVIEISGLYKRNEIFKELVCFSVDRGDINKNILVESIRNSFIEADKSVKNATAILKENINFSYPNTKFTYRIDDDKLALLGINDLYKSLPYTLIFAEGIEKVEIKSSNGNVKFSMLDQQPLDQQPLNQQPLNQEIFHINQTVPSHYKDKPIAVNVRIAIQVKTIENNKIAIISSDDSLPHIFLDFPLVGSENFTFPGVINYALFTPKEQRDGIFLDEAGKESAENRKIIEICALAYF